MENENIIVLDGKEFLISKELDIDNSHYIYAISLEEDEYAVLKQISSDGKKFVESVTDEEQLKKVMSKYLELES